MPAGASLKQKLEMWDIVYLFSQKMDFTSLVIVCILLLSRGLVHHK